MSSKILVVRLALAQNFKGFLYSIARSNYFIPFFHRSGKGKAEKQKLVPVYTVVSK